jgi:hypothetical protein
LDNVTQSENFSDISSNEGELSSLKSRLESFRLKSKGTNDNISEIKQCFKKSEGMKTLFLNKISINYNFKQGSYSKDYMTYFISRQKRMEGYIYIRPKFGQSQRNLADQIKFYYSDRKIFPFQNGIPGFQDNYAVLFIGMSKEEGSKIITSQFQEMLMKYHSVYPMISDDNLPIYREESEAPSVMISQNGILIICDSGYLEGDLENLILLGRDLWTQV